MRVTVLYLNPIFDSGSAHGYDIHDYMKISPKFGTEEDLKKLLDEIHRRGMQVIFQGDERGILGEKEFYDAHLYPIQWEIADEGLISHFKKLAQLRREMAAFTSSVIRTHYYSTGQLLSFFRGESGKGEILVVANNGTESITFELPEGVWQLVNGKEVIQDKGRIDIPPLQVRIFEHI